AAHVHSPTGGQGMNSGVMYAVLQLRVKDQLGPHRLPNLLESYSPERVPIIEKMFEMTTKVLNDTVAHKERSWELETKFFQLDVNYLSSLIVHDAREGDVPVPPVNVYSFGDFGRPQGGNGVPDAPHWLDPNAGDRFWNLFDVFTLTKHTVLVFAAENHDPVTDEVLVALQEYPAELVQSVVILPAHSFVRDNAVLQSADHVFRDTDRHASEGYIRRALLLLCALMASSEEPGACAMKVYFSKIFS
ncbi:hypothetical protein GLOTRDRAFT_41031, partial [Gloeophyllum trabeum ATCC 11539]